ncbi:MAG TPA: septum formation initiator family protein [Candidatus Paceibacterota bacterium]
MNRRNQRSRFRIIVSSPITLVLALILLILFGRAAYNIHAKAVESDRKLAEAQANLTKLQTNRDHIQSRIADLSTDAGVEASIREKYHAVAPGESVVVIVDSDSDLNARTASTTTPDVPKSWWARFWEAIGI